MKCSDEQFISNLIELNEKAKVAPDLIDIITAYARLCQRYGKEVKFYDKNPAISTNKPTIKDFIDKNPHLDKRSLSFLVSYAEMMRKRGLPFIFNITHLANFLEVEDVRLKQLIKYKEKSYHNFYIPKSNGGKRLISAPTDHLKTIQRKILKDILERVSLHPSANGFRIGRSVTTNAEKHTGQEVVIKIDIKDFFPSITNQRIKGIYVNLGYPDGVAETLTGLSTYKGRLPMGAPTSPYLANIVATRLDRRFANLSKKIDFVYSRYADDLAFSSKDKTFARSIPFFKKIIQDEGFEVNEEKVVIARKGGQQKVTGVVVNRKVNIEQKEYKRLRAVVHNCVNGDLREEMKKWGASSLNEFKSTFLGHINFVKMLNNEKGYRLLDGFRQISWPV
ncbi:MAG: RNA-directed DNA polymerase [Nitrospirae bacterium]|nr:RNA-directed DNA polymerase [Nitrospirota bacterium]